MAAIGVVENDERALQTLGGVDAVSKVRKKDVLYVTDRTLAGEILRKLIFYSRINYG